MGTGDNGKVYDVFLSYAHADNRTVDDSLGFVTKFRNALDVFGHFRRGADIKTFMDVDMASGTLWADEIKQALESSSIFLPIISASWQKSKYGNLEWETFKAVFPDFLGSSTQKPVFPILYETDRSDVTAELRRLQIKHSFTYTMTNKEFDRVAHAAVTEPVTQLKGLIS